MAGPTSDRSKAVTPDVLAAAMLNGLENRRFFRSPGNFSAPQIGPPPIGCGERVRQASVGLFDHPRPPAKGVRKRLWQMIQKLLSPIFDKQTHINETAADSLGQLQHYLGLLAEQVNALNRTMSGDVLAGYTTTNARLNECLYDVHQLRKAIAVSGVLPDAAKLETVPPIDPIQTLESQFLQTRVPPLPARALIVASRGLEALDLAHLGYTVVIQGGSRSTVSQSDLRILSDGENRDASFPDGLFDCAVAFRDGGLGGPQLRSARVDLARLLKRGGTFVSSTPIEGEVPSREEFAELVDPFELSELHYAHRADHGWSLTAEPTPTAELVLWVGRNV